LDTKVAWELLDLDEPNYLVFDNKLDIIVKEDRFHDFFSFNHCY